MDLDWLSDFLALANTRNFSSAANARYITQPAFSRRIQALEHWVGTPLIDRSSYPITLTTAGEVFRTSADEIVRAIHSTRDECRAEVRSDPDAISFAALHTLAITFFPRWIRGMEETLGPVHTRMQPHSLHDSVQSLVTGNCTFLLCYAHQRAPVLLDRDRYPSLKLASETLAPVVAPASDGRSRYSMKSGRKRPLPYLAYTPDSFLGKMVDLILGSLAQPLELETRYENSMAEAIKMMALEGYGVAWLPQSCVARELDAGSLVQIGDETHRVNMEIRIYRSSTPAKPSAERLWALLENAA